MTQDEAAAENRGHFSDEMACELIGARSVERVGVVDTD